jgi:membrane-bound serine protease (ClpP class)
MWIAICLSFVGFLLIYLEFFFPGGLIALLGGLAVVGGATYVGSLAVPLGWRIAYFLLSFGLTALTCKAALYYLRKKKGAEILLETSQEGYVASSYDQELIGREGSCQTDLKPSGHIVIDGARHQAVSEGEYLSKGTTITITGGRGACLVVKEKL